MTRVAKFSFVNETRYGLRYPVPQSTASFRTMDHLRSVGALAPPTFGLYARPQTPLARTRAVGPRVRDLYVGVAPDLCISGCCPSMLLAINRNFPRNILILGSHPFVCCVFQA